MATRGSSPSERTTIAGLSVITLCGGDRGTVLLLHGLAGSAAEMVPLARGIAAAGYRVLVPDQRGHGHSTRRPGDVSRAAYVRDAVALLDGPAWLVGQSMGAHTAMLVAAARPDLCRGLVMIEGGVGGAGDDDAERVGEWFASWPVPFADEDAARRFLGDTPVAHAWTADLERRADGLWPRFDADVMAAALREVAATARWADRDRVTAPVLIVLGEHGTLDRAEVCGPAVVVAGAGHDVHLDRPDETLRLILTFLDGS